MKYCWRNSNLTMCDEGYNSPLHNCTTLDSIIINKCGGNSQSMSSSVKSQRLFHPTSLFRQEAPICFTEKLMREASNTADWNTAGKSGTISIHACKKVHDWLQLCLVVIIQWDEKCRHAAQKTNTRDSSISAIHDVSTKWLHTVVMKAVWFLWGRISANWPSWINRARGVRTPAFSYLCEVWNKYYLSAPALLHLRGWKCSVDISSTPRTSLLGVFSPLIMSRCFLLSSFLLFLPHPHICTSQSPYLLLQPPLPLIFYSVWALLRLLIHCSVSRSIERLSVTTSHCTPPHPPTPPPVSPDCRHTAC